MITYLILYYQGQDQEKDWAIRLKEEHSQRVRQEIITILTSSSSAISNLNDIKLLHISWVYDINFYPTFQEIKNRNYIEDDCLHPSRNSRAKKGVKNCRELSGYPCNLRGYSKPKGESL